jgi:hypothetical protein
VVHPAEAAQEHEGAAGIIADRALIQVEAFAGRVGLPSRSEILDPQGVQNDAALADADMRRMLRSGSPWVVLTSAVANALVGRQSEVHLVLPVSTDGETSGEWLSRSRRRAIRRSTWTVHRLRRSGFQGWSESRAEQKG